MLYSNLLLTLTRTSEQAVCHLANTMRQIDGHVIVGTLYERKGQSLCLLFLRMCGVEKGTKMSLHCGSDSRPQNSVW